MRISTIFTKFIESGEIPGIPTINLKLLTYILFIFPFHILLILLEWKIKFDRILVYCFMQYLFRFSASFIPRQTFFF